MNTARFLSLLPGLLTAQVLHAASIQWDAPQNISGASNVSTEGAYYGSWSPGNGTAPAGTVNGVTLNGDDLEITSSGFAGSAAAFGTHTTADATYNGLLQYGTWSNGTSASFTLNGTGRRPFIPGRQYLVQVWVSDARAEINGRTETVGGSGTLSYKTGTGMGQYVVGRFTADAASQAISITASVSAQVNLVQVRDITPPEAMTRFQRWKTLKYGIFSHYTYAVTGDVNTAANGFNAQAYANDVAQAGAQYVVWTAWHGNMFPMFPSKAAERYGYGSRCSQRDTVSDMIEAVRAKGIRVYLYVHPFQPLTGDMAHHNNYINELFAEVIDRYGPRIDGLWIDENQINGDQDSLVDYKRLMNTIKSRNPDIVTMHNGGQMYTADMGGPEVVGNWNYGWSECMYNYVNPGNGPGAEDMLRTMVLEAASNFEGGGVHWSVDGKLNGGLVETARLFALGQYIAPIRASICETKPSTSFPPPYKDGRTISYNSVDWVATEALDDSKVYIHVLKPPAGTVLTLPSPADGKIFSSAKLLASGNPVGLVQNLYDGVQITLQGADTWNALDTVIELTVASKGGAGHVNDTSKDMAYTGSSWSYQAARGNGEFANDAHLATADGDSFTFSFNGTDVDYIATRGADRGQVEIYIDDVLQTTVDLSTGTAGIRQVAFSKSGLARGAHTLKGIKRSGTSMEVDCFKVTDLINDSDAAMNGAYLVTTDYGTGAAAYGGPSNWWQGGYNGANWITPAVNYYPGNEPLNDPANNEPVSDYFDFTFTGTGVQIPLSSAYSWAYFYMKVDGVFHSNVQVQQGQVSTFSVSGLAPGTHTVRGITWKATSDPSQPGINGFTVTRPDIWTAASGRGYGEIGDDVHYTDINPGRFSWNFDGSGVEVITTRDSDARMAWFGVSGMGYSIGARRQNFSLARQTGTSVFSLPNLVPGSYNLSVTHGANTSGLNFSFARLAINAVRVYKGQALSGAALQWGASGAGGTGTWDANTTANWFDGASAVKWPAAGGTADVATFGGTAGTVTLSGTINANRLQLQTTGYTLQGGTLTLNGSAPTLTTASGVSATIGSTVAGSAGLIKNGAGTLTLSAANSFTGTTTINLGTLALQNTWQGSAFHTEGGAVLDLNVATGTRDAGSTTFTGRGTLRKTGTGELRWGTGIAAFNFGSGGLLDVQAGTLVGGSNTNEDWTTNLADLNVASGAVFSGVESNVRVDALSGAGTIKSGFNGAGYAGFTFGVDDGSGTFSGVLANDSSTGNFTKAGSGTQILSGANTYTGTTTVSGGTLLVNGSLAAASAVTVASGATLSGTGTVGGALTVQSGGTLAPGSDGVGTLTSGSAAINGHLAVQFNGSTADRLTVTGNLDITNCTLDLSVLSGGLTQLQYVIASYGSLTGSQFAAVTGVPNGYQMSYDTANKRIMLIGQLTQPPRNLSAVGGVGRVALGWQPTIVGSETTYQIERATSSGGIYTVVTSTATGNSYIDTGVADGTTYFYRVRVSAGGSVGPVSNEASATTAAAGTLPPPLTGTSNIGGYGSPSVAYVSGTYTLNGSGAGATSTADSGYFLYVPIVGDCTIVAKVNSLGGSNSARRAGVMMRQSLNANAMEMGTLVGPTRIYNSYRTSTSGTASSSNNGSTATAPRWVRIVRSGNSLTGAHSTDGTSWTQFTARTITMSGTIYVGLFVCSGDTTTTIGSTFSNVSITGGCPANLAATVGSNSVNLTWTAVTGAASYNVKRATASGGPYTTVGTPTSNSYTDSVTANGTAFYYVVSAVGSSGLGESANSNEVVARPVMLVPAIPQGLSTTGGQGQISLTWNASANATGYIVKRGTSASGPFTQIGTTATNSYTDTTVTAGVTYYYVVVASNVDNQSDASVSASATSSGDGIWTAASDGNWSAAGNWQAGGVAFGADRSATFSQAAAVTVNQNISGLTLGALAFSNASTNISGSAITLATSSGTPTISVGTGVTATIVAGLGGSSGLAVTGPGTLSLTSAPACSGTTSISGGTLANGAAAGTSFSLNTLAMNGATLAAANAGATSLGNFQLRSDVTVGGTAQSVISADVRVIQSETRTFNVGATGDASGTDLLISGKLGHQNGTAWGYAVKSGAGTMKISGTNEIGSMTVNAGKLILQDTGIGGMGNGGLVNNALTELCVTTGNSVTWNNPTLSGSGTYAKTGSGVLTISNVNTYTGGTTVDEGTLSIAGSGGNGRIRGALTVNANGTVVTTGDGTGLGYNNQITALVINGGLLKTAGADCHIWNITGGVSMTGGELQTNGGVGSPTGNSFQWNRTSLATNASANTAVLSGRINLRGDSGYANWPVTVADGTAAADLLVSAAITNSNGAVAITKSGSGTMVMSGSNTYTGATTVNAGTLAVNGSLASSSAVSVGGTSATGTPTLTGTGTVNGSVAIQAASGGAAGTLNPGAVGTTGQLATGPTTLNGRLAIEINGTGCDRLNVAGNLNITTATLDLSVLPGGIAQQEYVIASFGSLTGTQFASVTGLPVGYKVTYDLTNKVIKLSPSFTSWAAGYGLSDPSPNGDPDKDGLPNALEYVLGGNPAQPNSGIAPTASLIGNNLVFTFQRADASETADITLRVEASTDLVNWNEIYLVGAATASSSPGVVIQENGTSPDTISVSIPQGSAAARFVRLRVIIAP